MRGSRVIVRISSRTNRNCCVSSLLFLVLAVIFYFSSFVFAQSARDDITRLRGVIKQDQIWSGHILVTDDVTIADATVTVEPGTVIEFTSTHPDRAPALTVGSQTGVRGDLRMVGSAEHPIVVQSRSGTKAGRILFYVRDRFVRENTSKSGGMEKLASTPNEITWRHVHFDNLGDSITGLKSRKTVMNPALRFYLAGSSHTLQIVKCSFKNTSRVEISASDQAVVTLLNNDFDDSKEHVALSIEGDRAQAGRPAGVTLARCRLENAASFSSIAALVKDNILIGPDAALAFLGSDTGESQAAGNYIHNTTKQDDGRYCLNVEQPNVRVVDNIIRGGTTCVQCGGRWMSGNVLIAEPRLESTLVKKSRTHHLVNALPVGAIFERNLLLGPAHSLIIPQPLRHAGPQDGKIATTIIRNNVLDGIELASQGIRLEMLARPPCEVSVINNIFVRVSTIIYGERDAKVSLRVVDHNAYAPMPQRPYDGVTVEGKSLGDSGWARHDLRWDGIAGLGFTGVPPAMVPDFDADILSGQRTVAGVCEALFHIYLPRESSPLVGAGESSVGTSSVRPASIGASEPLQN